MTAMIVSWAGAFNRFIVKTFTIAELEVRKLVHDPTEVVTRAFQPALWMIIFGEVFSTVHAIPTGGMKYLDFLTPGILAQGILFVAIFYGIAIIWERDLGIVYKLLASPTPHAALVLGKAVSAGARGLSQAVIIYLLAFFLKVDLSWNPLSLLGVIILVLVSSALFSTFSLIIATIVKTRERFMGIGQLLTMPLFFASNAIYPIEIMPRWLQAVAHVNPMTYEIDALRALMLVGGKSTYGLGVDFCVLVISTGILVLIGAKMYPRMAV